MFYFPVRALSALNHVMTLILDCLVLLASLNIICSGKWGKLTTEPILVELIGLISKTLENMLSS